jgi:hypothetical protein
LLFKGLVEGRQEYGYYPALAYSFFSSIFFIYPKNTIIMTAKQQAIKDIRKSLKANSKAFIAFRTELNPIMDELVNEQIKQQEHVS